MADRILTEDGGRLLAEDDTFLLLETTTGAWHPGDPWPGSVGGAGGAEGGRPPAWSPYIRFFLQAAIGPGNAWVLGASDTDRLDDGNTMAAFGQPVTGGDPVWVDLSCDCLDVDIHTGASTTTGVLSKADAGTLVANLADPTGKYDPMNPDTPYAIGGHSRLIAGIPVVAWAETVDPDTSAVTKHMLFTGTVDRWTEPWVFYYGDRKAKLQATDATKQFNRMNHPEQAPVGAGDGTATRLYRIVTEFGWPGIIDSPGPQNAGPRQATTLAQPAWEMIGRTLDDELGFVYVTPEGHLRWTNRNAWFVPGAPVVSVGCGDGLYDAVIDAKPTTFDTQLRNTVYAANTGGTTQTATNTNSVLTYGEQSYKRTDLGMNGDTYASLWAQTMVRLYAFPQDGLESVVLRPDADAAPWDAWRDILAPHLVTDLVRVVWDGPYTIDVHSRLVGVEHRITPTGWEVHWELVNAAVVASTADTFNVGPDADDHLDSAKVMA